MAGVIIGAVVLALIGIVVVAILWLGHLCRNGC